MAKFIMSFEDNTVKKELYFKGEKFSYEGIPVRSKMVTDLTPFKAQIVEKLGDQGQEILDALELFFIGDEEDISIAVNVLSKYE